jgi:Raffinose synthase or seed imbibition protein Sip1
MARYHIGVHNDRDCRLKSIREDAVKFPSPWTLKDTVAQLRQGQGNANGVDRHGAACKGMDAILMWHTLAGYWLGLQVEDHNQAAKYPSQPPTTDWPLPPGRLFYPSFPSGILDHDPSASDKASLEYGVGIPDDAEHFYRQYYDYLVHLAPQLMSVLKCDKFRSIGFDLISFSFPPVLSN